MSLDVKRGWKALTVLAHIREVMRDLKMPGANSRELEQRLAPGIAAKTIRNALRNLKRLGRIVEVGRDEVSTGRALVRYAPVSGAFEARGGPPDYGTLAAAMSGWGRS